MPNTRVPQTAPRPLAALTLMGLGGAVVVVPGEITVLLATELVGVVPTGGTVVAIELGVRATTRAVV